MKKESREEAVARLGEWSLKKTITRDELVKMLDAMEIDKIEVEECYGGSLEVFVYAKDDEEVYEDPSDYVGMGWVDSRGRP